MAVCPDERRAVSTARRSRPHRAGRLGSMEVRDRLFEPRPVRGERWRRGRSSRSCSRRATRASDRDAGPDGRRGDRRRHGAHDHPAVLARRVRPQPARRLPRRVGQRVPARRVGRRDRGVHRRAPGGGRVPTPDRRCSWSSWRASPKRPSPWSAADERRSQRLHRGRCGRPGQGPDPRRRSTPRAPTCSSCPIGSTRIPSPRSRSARPPPGSPRRCVAPAFEVEHPAGSLETAVLARMAGGRGRAGPADRRPRRVRRAAWSRAMAAATTRWRRRGSARRSASPRWQTRSRARSCSSARRPRSAARASRS